MAITRSQIARQLMQEGGLSDNEDQLQILGPLGRGVAREAPAVTKDILTLMATGGLGALPAAKRVITGRLAAGLIRPAFQKAVLGGGLGSMPTGSVSSQGQFVNPEDLISITDDSGADTGFSEYSDPGIAASYEGSFAKGGNVSVTPKLPTDIEPEKSDMAELKEFKQRFNLPEEFRLADGGDVSVKDAEKMAPPGESLAYINDDEAALLKSLGGAGKAVNQTGIPSYFVKKVFKKAAKAVKKVVKSPIGKAALAGAALYYAPGFGVKAQGGFAPFLQGAKSGLGKFFLGAADPVGTGRLGFSTSTLGKFLGTGKGKALAGIAGISALGGLVAGRQEEEIDSIASRISDETGIDVAQIRKEVQDAYASGDISGLQSKYPFLIPTSAAQSGSFADGGIARLGYENGGITNQLKEDYMSKLKELSGAQISDAEMEKLKQAQLVSLIKELAGAQVSDAERESIMKLIPQKRADGGIMRLGYAEGTNEAMQKQAEEAMKEGFPRYTDEDGNEVSLEEFLKAAAEEDKKMIMPKRKPPKEVQKRKEKNFKKAKPALEKESADMVEDLIRSKKAEGGDVMSMEEYFKAKDKFKKKQSIDDMIKEYEKYRYKQKYGPRDTAAEGGLMDLGGTEMDLRGGGFVPIGAKEKADDVPARLSKNEFVFTADAVRAAGGGSVEKGAQKMYNTMKQLEDSIA